MSMMKWVGNGCQDSESSYLLFWYFLAKKGRKLEWIENQHLSPFRWSLLCSAFSALVGPVLQSRSQMWLSCMKAFVTERLRKNMELSKHQNAIDGNLLIYFFRKNSIKLRLQGVILRQQISSTFRDFLFNFQNCQNYNSKRQ